MPQLPILSGREVVKALERGGYKIVRQRGSHIRMASLARPQWPVTVPRHKTIGRGLLRKIIQDAGLSIEQFLDLL
ncbi:MAG: addiction module toxin, HicA family [Candidatus Taylorbacteria bacterium]|nr:addiction module toxin, HicA family [Candidatus Taylorbacteria bacterium]